MQLPILALALTAFALGTAELVPNGLLSFIAADLNVSVPQAGWITTGFALGAMIGGPIVAAATLRAPRKPLVLALAALFLLSNAVTALSTDSFALVIVSRVIAGAMIGGFLGTAVTIASSLVPRTKRASAIAVVFTGFTVSNIVGVPIGNVVGRAFGWAGAFWVVAALALLGIIAMALAVPTQHSDAEDGAADRGLRVLRTAHIWPVFVAIALGYGGLFVVYTYIAPFLTEVSGFSDGSLTWVLLLFGVGLIVGNALGGYFADRSITVTVVVILGLLVLGLVGLWLLAEAIPAVLLLLLVLGGAGFGMVPPLQSYVLYVAGTASALVSALAAASFNAGVAAGSAVGGLTLELFPDYRLLTLVGAAVTVIGLVVFLLTVRSHERKVAAEIAMGTAVAASA